MHYSDNKHNGRTTMQGNRDDGWSSLELPFTQRDSYNHDILCKKARNEQVLPLPKSGTDLWDGRHVKLPCSSSSVYTEQGYCTSNKQKRWKSIETALKKHDIKNSEMLIKAIKSYNPNQTWLFLALKHFCDKIMKEHESEKFFKHTLPGIINLALQLPDLIKAPIPLLKKRDNRSITLSQQQIACLLANAFLCTFPGRNSNHGEYESFPKINFSKLYDKSMYASGEHKFRCILNYFERVLREMPTGLVTFTRSYKYRHEMPSWSTSDVKVASVVFAIDDFKKIEDAEEYIQVDFANKFIGGGVLGNGCVQEEIRFVICPELMVSMLFTEELEPNEALMIVGSERYSDYYGYGRDDFKFKSDYVDATERDKYNRKRTAVLAIDAAVFYDEKSQYRRSNLQRDLNKAWVGFSMFGDDKRDMNYPGVATGNWGCGAFGGSAQLKSLLQLMAAAQARRPLLYLTFRDEQLKAQLQRMYDTLIEHDVTVGKLYQLITKYFPKVNQGRDLFAFLESELQGTSDGNITSDSDSQSRMEIDDDTPPLYQGSSSNGTQYSADFLKQNTQMNTQSYANVTSSVKQLHGPKMPQSKNDISMPSINQPTQTWDDSPKVHNNQGYRSNQGMTSSSITETHTRPNPSGSDRRDCSVGRNREHNEGTNTCNYNGGHSGRASTSHQTQTYHNSSHGYRNEHEHRPKPDFMRNPTTSEFRFRGRKETRIEVATVTEITETQYIARKEHVRTTNTSGNYNKNNGHHNKNNGHHNKKKGNRKNPKNIHRRK